MRAEDYQDDSYRHASKPAERLRLWQREEAMSLSDNHWKLLRQLVELPPNKRVRTGSVPQEFIDLKDVGLAEIIPVGVLDLLTEITMAGRTALADAERSAAA
jgi:hypothetical protein